MRMNLVLRLKKAETQPASQNLNEVAARLVRRPSARPAPAKKKFLGLGDTQIILLAGMLIVEFCILFGFGIILYLNL